MTADTPLLERPRPTDQPTEPRPPRNRFVWPMLVVVLALLLVGLAALWLLRDGSDAPAEPTAEGAESAEATGEESSATTDDGPPSTAGEESFAGEDEGPDGADSAPGQSEPSREPGSSSLEPGEAAPPPSGGQAPPPGPDHPTTDWYDVELSEHIDHGARYLSAWKALDAVAASYDRHSDANVSTVMTAWDEHTAMGLVRLRDVKDDSIAAEDIQVSIAHDGGGWYPLSNGFGQSYCRRGVDGDRCL